MKAARLFVAVLIAAALPCAWLAADDDGAATAVPGAARSGTGEEVPAPAGVADAAAGARGLRYVGTASCTAANCHGGDGSRPVRPGGDPLSPQAYSVWIQNDPHAAAFEALYGPRSQRIAERLGLANAYTAPACLACHTVKAPPAELADAARYTPHDGVGCEACHGAAESWLDPHKWAAWSSLSAAQKQALGYRDLADLTARARLCAECHVGSAGRDVNHDLIAAGHPRMSFELSAYHANLPKHWQREATPAGELDARLWLVGQAASAESGLALLAHRAGDAKAPWPEFSEYDCFACHHDLADPSWRQQEFAPTAELPPGAAPWGSWHYPFLALIRDGAGQADNAPLNRLRAEMQRLSPNRETVRTLAEAAHGDAAELAASAARRPIGPLERTEWIRRLTEVQPPTAPESWDAAAQRFLACAAMNFAPQAARDGNETNPPAATDAIAGALTRIRELLQFSNESDPVRYDSPRNQTGDRRRAVSAAFEEIHEAASDDGTAG